MERAISRMDEVFAGSRHRMRCLISACLFSCTTIQILSAQTSPWMNTSLRPDERAALLAAEMTLDEKIALVHGWPGPYVGDGTNTHARWLRRESDVVH